jgi:multiple sugar transport system permease protein
MAELTTSRPRAQPAPDVPGRVKPPSSTPRQMSRFRRRATDNLAGYLFLVGAVAAFAFFSWYPIVRGLITSFQQINFVTDPTFVGWDNFKAVLDDPLFWPAWRNTLYFTGLALVFGYAIPFAAAILLNELRHFKGFFRVAVYLPVMLPPIVGVFLWKGFYDPGDGLFNNVLGLVGIPPLAWLDSTDTAMISLVLVSTWANMGTSTIIYLAGLQSIPGELYEAAELDGAGLWHRLRHVTVPQMRFLLLVMLLLQIIATMQVFIEPFTLTGGGPEDSTVTVLLLIYRYAFITRFDFGMASALTMMLFVVLAMFSALYLRLTRRAD